MKYLLIVLALFSQALFADRYELGDQLDSGTDSYLRQAHQDEVDREQTEALNRIDADLRDLNDQLSND